MLVPLNHNITLIEKAMQFKIKPDYDPNNEIIGTYVHPESGNSTKSRLLSAKEGTYNFNVTVLEFKPRDMKVKMDFDRPE